MQLLLRWSVSYQPNKYPYIDLESFVNLAFIILSQQLMEIKIRFSANAAVCHRPAQIVAGEESSKAAATPAARPFSEDSGGRQPYCSAFTFQDEEGSETEIRFGAFGKGKYSSCRVRLPGQMNMEVSRLNFLRQFSGAFHGDRTVEKAVGMLPFLIPRYSSFPALHNSGNDHPHPSAPEQTESRPPQDI